jgi:flagellar biosynthesis protein FlhA
MANLVAMLRLPGNLKSTQWQILAGPILILLILSMMVLPLPAFILDLLFTFNIALSIMVLLVAMFTQRTLEFAAFPTILLFTTLLRLALNVASTRIILMEGHTGRQRRVKWLKRSATSWWAVISLSVSWCSSSS